MSGVTLKNHFAEALMMFLLLMVFSEPHAEVSCNSSQLCNMSVLIEQNSVSDQDYPELLNRVPSLEQLHLRISGPGSGIVLYGSESPGIVAAAVTTIKLIRSANPNVKLGFHPDLSSTSYASWNCSQGDDACLFENSIWLMNAINSQLEKNEQLTIYSLEQSYNMPKGMTVALQKACLQGNASATCPTPANPAVEFGYVAPSCMGDSLYGPTGYDYGYPQMYGTFGPNNVSPTHAQYNWYTPGPPSNPSGPIPASVYPPVDQWPAPLQGGQYGFVLLDSYQITIPPPNPPLYDNEQVIPYALTQFNDGDIHSIYEQSVFTKPTDVGDTLSALVLGKYADKVNDPGFPCGVPLTGNTRYFTLSGEPEFLGSAGWTIGSLNQFFTEFASSLQKNGASAPAVAGIRYAIWGFDTMTGSLLGENAKTPSVLGRSSQRVRLEVSTGYGHGQVTSEPEGILCGRRCTHPFIKGSRLKLAAAPDPGYRFVRWKGVCKGVKRSCRLRMSRDRSIIAEFARIKRKAQE